MIVVEALQAFAQILSPPFRRVLLNSIGLTLALLALVWIGLTRLLDWWLAGHDLSASYPWLDAYVALLAGFGLVVGLVFLIPPVSMLVAGFFIDDVAELVERESFPDEPPGVALPLGPAMVEPRVSRWRAWASTSSPSCCCSCRGSTSSRSSARTQCCSGGSISRWPPADSDRATTSPRYAGRTGRASCSPEC